MERDRCQRRGVGGRVCALLELGAAVCSVVLCRGRPSTNNEAKILIFDQDSSFGTRVGRPRVGDDVVGSRRWDDMVMVAEAPSLAPTNPHQAECLQYSSTRPDPTPAELLGLAKTFLEARTLLCSDKPR